MSRPLDHDSLTSEFGSSVVLRLKKGCDRRLHGGHDWVFSNEIGIQPKITNDQLGCLATVQNHQGKFLATAYYNSKSLIAARILSRQPLQRMDANWFVERITEALQLRTTTFKDPYYRAVFGESDGLPGLVVDRFGDYLVAQITTAGIERVKAELELALHRVFIPTGIVWRADDKFRELEGLTLSPPQMMGSVPDCVPVKEGSLTFEARLMGGQKTGWFYDQRDNRLRLHKYCQGKRILDVFSYAGGWAIHGLAAGAVSATCIDTSSSALESAQRNARMNSMSINPICGDAFVELKKLVSRGEKFDVVVIDPPALIKRKKDYEAGLQAYYQLNRLAVQLLPSSGLLVSCSCSHHLELPQLLKVVQHSAFSGQRRVRITELGQQSIDHPIHPAIPESEYLKAVFAWIS